MGVHVGHVEISVVPTGDAPVNAGGQGVATPKASGEVEEHWLQSQARIEWLTNRVRADDFND